VRQPLADGDLQLICALKPDANDVGLWLDSDLDTGSRAEQVGSRLREIGLPLDNTCDGAPAAVRHGLRGSLLVRHKPAAL
jgi:hypothetical protein